MPEPGAAAEPRGRPARATPVRSPEARGALERSARRLSWFTVLYNLLEGVASVIAGAIAGSTALTGFGMDSFIESLSGGVMIWRFGRPVGEADRREERALRLVGVTFFLLGAYVLYEGVHHLVRAEPPQLSIPGIAITVLSLIVMPLLYLRKRRTARALGSASLGSDARQTLACVKLSAAVLLGLVLNAALGWWQADPLIAIAIALSLFHEGWEAIQGGDDD